MLYDLLGMSLAFVVRCGFVLPQTETSGRKPALAQQLGRYNRCGSGKSRQIYCCGVLSCLI